jgi:hypothetical protein
MWLMIIIEARGQASSAARYVSEKRLKCWKSQYLFLCTWNFLAANKHLFSNSDVKCRNLVLISISSVGFFPKWRNFAQSGHTASARLAVNLSPLVMSVIRLRASPFHCKKLVEYISGTNTKTLIPLAIYVCI